MFPIKNGAIINQRAFHYFIKLVYKSVARPGYPTALIIASSSRWARSHIELLTQYVFESLHVPGFSLVPCGLASAFAFALQDALVIDVGLDKTEITPVLEFAVVNQAQRIIDLGGSSINKELGKLLPDLTEQQIEDLKKSNIYEVLSEDDTKNSWFGQQETNAKNPDEDGIIDVAAIVASGRTREILAERERQKGQPSDEPEKSNMDREFNTFIDSDGKVIEVGKQRFHGTENLIERITLEVGRVVQNVDQVNRRQDLWDNLVILGRGSSVKGFKEALISSLNTRYLINRPTTYSELPSTFNTGHNTPSGGTPMYNGGSNNIHLANAHQGHGQSPTSIRSAKMPEYFSDWKGRGWEDAAFLGMEIAARPIFTGSVENTFVSMNDYNEVGPTSIWDIGVF